MSNSINDLVQDVVASPLGAVIASVGEGVAEAQQALDEGSLAKTLEIYTEGGEEALRLLREIGYRPTFYALPETTGEVRISMHLGKALPRAGRVSSASLAPVTQPLQPAVNVQLARIGQNIGIKPRLYATPVDAGYANRYGYKADISAKLTFKIVPVPAPDGADELRILPDFVSRTVKQSRLLAETLGLEIRFVDKDNAAIMPADDSALVATQVPEYHSDSPQYARLGEEIVLRLKDKDSTP